MKKRFNSRTPLERERYFCSDNTTHRYGLHIYIFRSFRKAFRGLRNLRAVCGKLSEAYATFAQFAGRFPRPMQPSRSLREAFRGLRNLPAVCGKFSEAYATFLQFAGSFPRPTQPSCSLREVFRDLCPVVYFVSTSSSVTEALCTSPPSGGFSLVSRTLMWINRGKALRNARRIRPAACSSRREGRSISAFTVS